MLDGLMRGRLVGEGEGEEDGEDSSPPDEERLGTDTR